MTTTDTTSNEPIVLTRSTVVETLTQAWGAAFATTEGLAGWFAEAFSANVLKPNLPGERVTEQNLVDVYGTLQAIADGAKRMMDGMDTFMSDDWQPIDPEGTLAMAELDLLGGAGDTTFMLGEGGEAIDDTL